MRRIKSDELFFLIITRIPVQILMIEKNNLYPLKNNKDNK